MWLPEQKILWYNFVFGIKKAPGKLKENINLRSGSNT